jgi:hypothetical protein
MLAKVYRNPQRQKQEKTVTLGHGLQESIVKRSRVEIAIKIRSTTEFR